MMNNAHWYNITFVCTKRIAMKVVRGPIIGCIIGITLVIVPLVSVYNTVFSIKRCILTFDPTLSHAVCMDVQTYLEANQIPSKRLVVENLKTTFPVLKSVSVHQRKSGVVHIICNAHEPFFDLNQEKIVLQNGALVERTCFVPEAVDAVCTLSLTLTDEATTAPAGLISWLQAAPIELFKRYEVTWHDQTNIELIDTQNRQITILLQSTNELDESLLAYCASMIPQAVQKKGTNRPFVADLRFEGQLVLYSKRGNNEGKNIF